MENDSIRASGTDTLVDIWIDGKMRSICVSHEAIGAFVGFEQAAALTDDSRCEFVRTHLPLVITAAKARLRETGYLANTVTIDVGELPRPDGQSGERRRSDRRKTERRKQSLPLGSKPERRRGDRRQGQRRTRGAKKES